MKQLNTFRTITAGVLSLLITLSPIAAQTAAPAQTPASTSSAQKQTAEETVQLSTSLVQVPVVVMDRNGHPVKSLTKEQFQVEEDGVKQPLSTFSRQAGRYQIKNDNSPSADGVADHDVPIKFLIVFDTYHLNREFNRARDAALKFVKDQKGATESAAVVATESGLKETQVKFTPDPMELSAAIQKIRQNAHQLVDIINLEMSESDAFLIDRNDRGVIDDYVDRYSQRNHVKIVGMPGSSRLTPASPPLFEGEGQAAKFVLASFSSTPQGGKPGGGAGGGTGTGGGTTGGGTTGGGSKGGGPTGGGTGTGSGGSTGTGGTGGRGGTGGFGSGGSAPSADPAVAAASGGMMTMERSIVVDQIKSAAAQMVQESTYNTARDLDALRAIISGFSKIEGRKVLVLLSEGFFLDLANSSAYPVAERVQAIVDFAARSNTTIYSFDVRGLVVGGSAASSGLTNGFGRSSSVSRFGSAMSESQNGLMILSQGTGGISFQNNNDLSAGFQAIVRDNSYYYMLGYTPTKGPDGKYRKISVKVNNSDYKVRARDGYFALEPGHEVKIADAAPALSEKDKEEFTRLATAASQMLHEKKYDEAIKGFEQALALNPNHGAVHFYLGSAYAGKNDVEKALQHWKLADQATANGRLDAKLNIATVLVGRQDYVGAKPYLKVLVAAEPKNPTYLLSYARALVDTNEVDKGLELLLQAHELLPSDVELLLEIGSTATRAHKTDVAVNYLRQYIKQGGRQAEDIKKYLQSNGIKPDGE